MSWLVHKNKQQKAWLQCGNVDSGNISKNYMQILADEDVNHEGDWQQAN